MRVLLGAFAVGLTLTACAGEPVITHPIASAPAPTPTACEAGRYMLHGTASADYLEFIRLNAVLFVEPKVLSMTGGITSADLGSKVAAVRCKLDAANVDPRAPLRDGDASFIESGTAVYAVKGYSPECRVAAKQLGKLTLFLATKPGGEHIAAACPSTAKTP